MPNLRLVVFAVLVALVGMAGLVGSDILMSAHHSGNFLDPWRFHSDMNDRRPNAMSAMSSNYVYVSGGGVVSQGLPHQSSVERAEILPGGEIGPWTPTSSMQTVRGGHGGATWGDYVYFGGGQLGNSGKLNTVEMMQELSGGGVTAFSPVDSMSVERSGVSLIAHDSCLYAIGGNSNAGAELSVESSVINANGTLAGWNPVSSSLLRNSSWFQAVATDTHVYAGGNWGTQPLMKAAFTSGCGLGAWSDTGTSLPARFHGAAVSGERLYLVGGSPFVLSHPNERSERVISAEIDPLTGELGAWQNEPDMTQERENGTAQAIGDYLYAIGGSVPWNHHRSVERAVLPLSELDVVIDIKPGSDQNSVGCKSRGVVPVAVLGSSEFDATAVEADSVRFGVTGIEASEVHLRSGAARRHVEDVNGDGFDDMVFHFRLSTTGFSCTDIPDGVKTVTVDGLLTGQMSDGTEIEGVDSIRLVGGKKG